MEKTNGAGSTTTVLNFQFREWRNLELAHWRTEYEEANPIHVRDLSGQDHLIGDENEAINGLAFSFMRTVLRTQLSRP